MTSTRTTILDVIRIVLPDGSAGKPASWDKVCPWPPDLFAVAATITEKSGLYSERTFMAYWGSDFALTTKWKKEIRSAGNEWALLAHPPRMVQRLWAELIRKHGNARVDDPSSESIPWKKIVYRLLTIADVACTGIGFPPSSSRETVQYAYVKDYFHWYENNPEGIGGELLPYIPHSLCSLVPPAILCVQPKTNTPAVGCTLRSLTHNLALLPSISNVTTHWHIAAKPHDDLDPFNVLVVPFPFSIPGKSFLASRGGFPSKSRERAFRLDPDVWMRGASPEQFAGEFLCGLLKSAEPELEPVHGIVLPETALKLGFANRVAEILARNTDLDLFVTGVIAGEPEEARNTAAIYQFFENQVLLSSFQSKHHRWCLNDDQIRRYHLGHVMDPHNNWWEQIDVSYRNCYVTLFRPGATLSVLVCEDLARYDPVLTVMNAIGPNLVIALLMDGPQINERWPARYATVLADDPGSAVLTVTPLGMVLRSAMPGDPQNREIALWKEPAGNTRILRLPKGDHGLLLTLTCKRVEQFTLDGRGDGGHTVRFGLGAVHPIRHDNPPKWLGPML